MVKKKQDLKNLQKNSPKYFQGTIQIRGNDFNQIKKIVDLAQSKFSDSIHFISKIEEVKGGIDLYSSSNKFSRKIGKWLYENNGGELVEAEKLFTRDKLRSKDVFRLTVTYRIPEYMNGEIISLNNTVIKINLIRNGILYGDDLETGKKVHIKLDSEIKRSIIHLKIHRSKIIALKPEPLVLDPDTYQPLSVKNKKKGLREDKWVRFVVSGDYAYLI